MRTPEIELDFKNALASVLYRQGNTVVLACATKASAYQDGSREMRLVAGLMLNIH